MDDQSMFSGFKGWKILERAYDYHSHLERFLIRNEITGEEAHMLHFICRPPKETPGPVKTTVAREKACFEKWIRVKQVIPLLDELAREGRVVPIRDVYMEMGPTCRSFDVWMRTPVVAYWNGFCLMNKQPDVSFVRDFGIRLAETLAIFESKGMACQMLTPCLLTWQNEESPEGCLLDMLPILDILSEPEDTMSSDPFGSAGYLPGSTSKTEAVYRLGKILYTMLTAKPYGPCYQTGMQWIPEIPAQMPWRPDGIPPVDGPSIPEVSEEDTEYALRPERQESELNDFRYIFDPTVVPETAGWEPSLPEYDEEDEEDATEVGDGWGIYDGPTVVPGMAGWEPSLPQKDEEDEEDATEVGDGWGSVDDPTVV